MKVAERKAAAGSIIGLAAAVASLKLGPGKGDSGKVPKGSGQRLGRGGRGRGKGRGKGRGRSAPKPEDEPDMKKDSDEESQLSDEILDSDEEINKAHRAGKSAKRARKQPNGVKPKVKGKAKAKAKGKKTGDDNEKPKRSFPKSHLFDEWKKFSNEQKAKLQGKMPYHPMMKEIAKMCLGPILYFFCKPYDESSEKS